MRLQRFSTLRNTLIYELPDRKRVIVIIITLCIDNNVVLILIFLPAVKHRYEPFENITLTKNGFNRNATANIKNFTR